MKLLKNLSLKIGVFLLAFVVSACLFAPTAQAGVIASTTSEIDDTDAARGIIKARYTGTDAPKLKVQAVPAGSSKALFTQDLAADGRFSAFSITAGAGTYTFRVLKLKAGTTNTYSVIQSLQFTVQSGGSTTTVTTSAPSATSAPSTSSTTSNLAADSRFAPFLVSNSTVVYSSSSAAVKKAADLCASAASDVDKVAAVYKWITDNVTYDYDKMTAIQNKTITSYTPDVDVTLSVKKGICYDYAALMAAMLRSQGVPTKLIKGYCTVEGRFYHAWNEVYIQGTGWVRVAGSFYFDGKSYQKMDSTYSAANKKYELKSSNYETTKEY